MGGNCFRQKLGIEGKRLSKNDYLEVAGDVLSVLVKLFDKFHLVRSYLSKIDHGDQDWLVSGYNNKNVLKQQLMYEFDLPEEFIHQNSKCFGRTGSGLLDWS